MMEEGGASGHHADEDFNVVLQSLQRDINCLTAKDRAVRKQAITKLHKALVACTKVGAEPQRRFVVPKNPVALRSEAGLKSAPRNFTLKRGDVVLLLEQREVEGRQRVRFEKNGVDCWASINAGDGGVLLQETEPLMPDTVGGVAPKAGMLEYLLGKMLRPLLQCFRDPVEKCRELSALALIEAIGAMPDAAPLFDVTVQVVWGVLGQKVCEEEAEEIRLVQVKLLHAFLRKLAAQAGAAADAEAGAKACEATVAPKLEQLAQVMQRMADDAFPEIKKETAACIAAIAACAPIALRHWSPAIAVALLANTGHQHSRVRGATVDALGVLVLHGAAEVWAELEPPLLVLARDRSTSVREALARVVSSWMPRHAPDVRLLDKLLRLVIAGIADEAASINATAIGALEAAAIAVRDAKEAVAEGAEAATPMATESAAPAPEPAAAGGAAAGRPMVSALAQELLCANLRALLPVLLKELGEWTVALRGHAVPMLRVLLGLVGEAVAVHLGELLPALYRATGDDEPEIVTKVALCVEMLGESIEIEVWLPLLVEDIKGRVAAQSTAQLQQCISCLRFLLSGVRRARLATLPTSMLAITTLLSTPSVCSFGTLEVQTALLDTVEEIVTCIEALECGCTEEQECGIFVVLLQQIANKSLPALQHRALAEMHRFTAVVGRESLAALYQAHFDNVFEGLVRGEGYRAWRTDSPARSLFDVLLRGGGAAMTPHMTRVLLVFADTLQLEREPELRMGFLVLLDTLCNNPTLHECLRMGHGGAEGEDAARPYMTGVLEHMVQPNMVWRAGRVAAKVRKAACVVLHTIARHGLAAPEHYMAIAPKLFPTLLTALDDDYEASTRLVVCQLLDPLLSCVGERVGEELCRSLYGDLLKRLDDNEDEVRVQALGALSSLLPCIPVVEGKTMFEYIAQTLLIHLDDPSEHIRTAVLPVLLRAGSACPAPVIKKAREALQKTRSCGPALAQEVLDHATKNA